MALAGILFLVAAAYGNTAVWLALAAVLFVGAGMNYRRRKNNSGDTMRFRKLRIAWSVGCGLGSPVTNVLLFCL